MRHLVDLIALAAHNIDVVFSLTRDLKSQWIQGIREPLLPGRIIALLFESVSVKARISFGSAIAQLGGCAAVLGSDVGFRTRDSIEDFSRVLSTFVDAIVVRTGHHA